MSERSELVEIADGQFDLHLWLPQMRSGPAILLIQEIFGVGGFIRAVAAKLTSLGYVVGSPDVFWRFHRGYTATHDEAGLADAMSTVQQHLDFPLAVADCIAALERLDRLPEVAGRPAVLGYCLGGGLAWAVAGHDSPACCVSYYGPRVPHLLDLAGQVSCPTLLHFGDSDRFIPAAGIEAVTTAIAGRSEFTINIERAGHAFENHEAAMFYDAAAARSSWAQTDAFLATHLAA